MRTQKEVESQIREVEAAYRHVLTGSLATVHVNAPRALEQIATETKLRVLHWVLGTRYKSKLKGVDR